MRGLPRILAPTAADVDAELLLERTQTTLQSADYTSRDAGGMPVLRRLRIFGQQDKLKADRSKGA